MTSVVFQLENLDSHSLVELRVQQRSLRLVSVANMALDHDFHIAGAVPSVCVIIDIPKDSKDSFHDGKVHVTVKDKSVPSIHCIEGYS